MALVSQFLNANDIVGSISRGQRDQERLFKLEQELIAAQRNNMFNTAADPYRIETLRLNMDNQRMTNRAAQMELDGGFTERRFANQERGLELQQSRIDEDRRQYDLSRQDAARRAASAANGGIAPNEVRTVRVPGGFGGAPSTAGNDGVVVQPTELTPQTTDTLAAPAPVTDGVPASEQASRRPASRRFTALPIIEPDGTVLGQPAPVPQNPAEERAPRGDTFLDGKTLESQPTIDYKGPLDGTPLERVFPRLGDGIVRVDPASFSPEQEQQRVVGDLTQRFKFAPQVHNVIQSTSARYGIDPRVMYALAQIESTGNPLAKNKTSSAGGLYQQIDSNAKQYGVQNRYNAAQSADGAARFMLDNRKVLMRVLGREPNAGEYYLAHQQGPEGARRLLANPNALAARVLGKNGAQKVRLNGGDPGTTTAREFANKWMSKANKLAYGSESVQGADWQGTGGGGGGGGFINDTVPMPDVFGTSQNSDLFADAGSNEGALSGAFSDSASQVAQIDDSQSRVARRQVFSDDDFFVDTDIAQSRTLTDVLRAVYG